MSDKKINEKDRLILNDKDFIIKYETLMLNRELGDSDFSAHSLDVDLPYEVMLKIVELEVKKSIQSEISYLSANQYQSSADGSPTPMPFNSFMWLATYVLVNNGSLVATTVRPDIPVPHIDPLLPPRPPWGPWFKPESLYFWATSRNNQDFKVDVTISDKVKDNQDTKDHLTLTDKDITIKYGHLFLNKELEESELSAYSLTLAFSNQMIGEITELAVRNSVRGIIGLYVDGFPIDPDASEGPWAIRLLDRHTLFYWAASRNKQDFKVGINVLKE